MKAKTLIILLLFFAETATVYGNDALVRVQQNVATYTQNDVQKYILITVFAIVLFVFMLFQTIFLYLSNMNTRKLNISLAKQHHDSQEQNEEIKQQNEEIRQQNEEIASINEHLEGIVAERTKELEFTIESLSTRNGDLEQFSYILSHQVRAPIARLIGLANIFNKENIADPINQDVLMHTQQSAKDLDTIIKDLAYILSIKNEVVIEKELFDVSKVTKVVLGSLNAEICEAKADINIKLEGLSIFSVKKHWESIIYNLLSNAIKFRNKRAKLQIAVEGTIQNDMFYFTVKDNGIGLDLNQIDTYKIFGLYQRMHTHVKGKGFGLYVTKTQIEALGGKITVESAENVGSIFKVSMPL
ncbi:MAG: sensor histidine kinase [Cytophagales bacterium]|nr:MAG: sensor histidine kinase [Cytophagales bacterium]